MVSGIMKISNMQVLVCYYSCSDDISALATPKYFFSTTKTKTSNKAWYTCTGSSTEVI